ncbi:hypothetical protein NAEGRDRAFT_59832 [Naegleria gruberi]|uniref:Uncharacterized protein n=1 Tax=Naegleria gruberi TaxID=5762 RepID=D2W1B4_NAEGR|nr:uncharacterized protein NAEGRDRAFT_59832 [Naegleria gruberi]EFC37196.1 hypothetical protein NAEGRDRAFT_59832 [Naegleria gruberi]|eukprot:XP_002669940.1 hypothetical protein NAEGRDRAFT_59832 [Naegleria gruberi strain NEG-M]
MPAIKPVKCQQQTFKRLREIAVKLSVLLLVFGICSHQTLIPSQSIEEDNFQMNSLIRIFDSKEYYSIVHNTRHQADNYLDNSSSSSQQLNNSSTNSTVDPLNGCYTILLNLGDFSRYGPNATVIYGICPETWLSVSFSIAIMFFYSILFILTCFGLYWKRNSRHIQSRGLVYMFLTLFASAFIIYSTSLRYAIGRREYPCFIYSVTYFVLPPSLILPAIFRCYRLVLLHLLNLRKMKMLIGGTVGKSTTNLESLAHKITKKGNGKSSNNTTTNTSTNTTIVEAFQNNADVQSNGVMNESSGATSPVSNISIDSSVALTRNESSNTSPRAFLKKKSASNFSLKDVDRSVKMVDFDVTEYSMADDDVKSYTYSDGFSVAREDFEKEMKRAKVLNFFVSNLFIVLCYFIIFSLHVILFLIMGGIEWDQKLRKGTTIFTNDGGLFTVERGCGITNSTFILVGVETFFYIVVEYFGCGD